MGTAHSTSRSRAPDPGCAKALIRGLTRSDILCCLVPIGFFVSMLSFV